MGREQLIISNSTPLINFAAIRRLDILAQLFGRICVPKAIEQELLEKGKEYPTTVILKECWSTLIDVIEVKNVLLSRVLQLNVDDGEAEAITLALEHSTKWLLLDENRGRMIAESYSLPIIGSIGCLIQAKRSGIIPGIKPLLDAMQTEARFWVSTNLYNTILREQGE
jgi:predicted nucleic acid-binding protein